MKKTFVVLAVLIALMMGVSCTKSSNNSTNCNLNILKSPSGQNQGITANIDNAGYTNINPQTLLAEGGSLLHNYTWSVEASPTPPSGFSFWPLTGVITRTGTTANGLSVGTRTFKVKVSDGTCTDVESINLIVTGYTPGPSAVFQQLSSAFTLMDADVNKPYGASLFAMGGTPPYNWTLDNSYAGSAAFISAGLTVDASGGIVRATTLNSTSGSIIKFKVIVTDNAGETAVYSPVYTINVN